MQDVVEVKALVDAQIGFAQLGESVPQRLNLTNQFVYFRHSLSLRATFEICLCAAQVRCISPKVETATRAEEVTIYSIVCDSVSVPDEE